MNKDGFVKMAQESLEDAMEMIDNFPDQTNCWIPFYIGKAWGLLELFKDPVDKKRGA